LIAKQTTSSVDIATGPRWNEPGHETLAPESMIHRHLNHQELTLAAIDDIIGRGKRKDWEALRTAVLATPALLGKVRRVCRAHVGDPYEQRHHFWMHYAEAHSPA
jgi:hypothetical protein